MDQSFTVEMLGKLDTLSCVKPTQETPEQLNDCPVLSTPPRQKA